MAARKSGRVRKPVTAAGEALVKHRSTAAVNRRRGRPMSGSASTGGTRGRRARAAPVDKDKEWEVEGLTGIMKDKNEIWYEVKWEDWDPETNTWEPHENVAGVDDVKRFEKVAEFLEGLPEADKTAKKKGKGKGKGKQDPGAGKQDDDDWEVEQVLGISWNFDDDQLEYLIKWLGWPHSSNSWEPESNLNASELVKPFSQLADFLSRSWGGYERVKPASKAKPASTPQKKKPAGRLTKASRKRAATPDQETDEEKEDVNGKDGDSDEEYVAPSKEDTDDEDEKKTEDADSVSNKSDRADSPAPEPSGDEDEEKKADSEEDGAGDGPSPAKRKRGRPASKAKKAPAKKSPKKKAAKKTPAKRKARR